MTNGLSLFTLCIPSINKFENDNNNNGDFDDKEQIKASKREKKS